MEYTPFRMNLFLFFKLPAAFWCGVRVHTITENQCVSTVKHRWMNQNPFQSLYFAVQAMAAELTTGALVLIHIRKTGKNISMLVANQNGHFSKKARGRIYFKCVDGDLVKDVIDKAVKTGEGQTVWLRSIGTNASGETVSELQFEWTLKVKS
jgi:hypothetical protein